MPTHKSDLTVLTLTQLGQLVGRKPETIRRMLDGLEPIRTDGRSRFYESRPALERIFGTDTIDLSRERARLASAQAGAQELKNEETAGRLLDRDEVIQTWSQRIIAAKSKLRSIPKRLRSRVPRFTASMARLVQQMIDEALDELAGDGIPPQRKRRRPAQSATRARP